MNLKQRLERLEQTIHLGRRPKTEPLLAESDGNGSYLMWGRSMKREDLAAIAQRERCPVVIMDLL